MRSKKAQVSTVAQIKEKKNSQTTNHINSGKNEPQHQQPLCSPYINCQAIAPRDDNFSLPHIVPLRPMWVSPPRKCGGVGMEMGQDFFSIV